MIRLFNLTKSYPGGSTPSRTSASRSIGGEFVFLTGPSGAGKTTLLRLLLRQELPTSGQVLVNGRNVGALPQRKVPELRRSIGVVFQDFKLIARKTALDNVAYVLNVAGVSVAEQRRRAFAAMRSVGLHHRIQVLPPALSGGEQQRVAIARAVVNEPVLLLADEPTGNLDPELGREIMKLFTEINARGTTVVVATHDIETIRRMQRRVVVLQNGRMKDDGRS